MIKTLIGRPWDPPVHDAGYEPFEWSEKARDLQQPTNSIFYSTTVFRVKSVEVSRVSVW